VAGPDRGGKALLRIVVSGALLALVVSIQAQRRRRDPTGIPASRSPCSRHGLTAFVVFHLVGVAMAARLLWSSGVK